MQYRIGDRDPETGLYYVIHPDGSQLLNGIKIFNAAHEIGDPILATRRSDGMMILDSAKAVDSPLPSSDLRVGEFGAKPIGYLQGQVFNNEDEEILPIVTITLAPKSPLDSKPKSLSFYNPISAIVRFSVDRPYRKDLSIDISLLDNDILLSDFENNLQLSAYGDLTHAKVKLSANLNYVDVNFTPARNSSEYKKTNYSPILKSAFAVPKVRLIKADLNIPFKCNRSLVYKIVESGGTFSGFNASYPFMFFSNIDLSSFPFIFDFINPNPTNAPDAVPLDYGSFPANMPPFRDVYTQILLNPDPSPDAWVDVRYLEFILPNLAAKSIALNKRYLYVIERRISFHNEPPVTFNDNRNRSWRHTASVEISGSHQFFGASSQIPIATDLINPYLRLQTQHLGYVESRWLFRSVKTSPESSLSFYQSCLKIDIQEPIKSKFILSTPVNVQGLVVNPDPQTIFSL